MEEINRIFSEMKDDDRVQQMRSFTAHGKVNTFDHCCSVASLSSRINRALKLHADEETLLKGAMLHDYYLYDWHEEDDGSHKWHGFKHARTAARNAKRDFAIDDKTEQVILSHMWPLNVSRIPRSREAWIVCVADKCVSLKETLFHR
ncbi:MAG: HD domain-containing protein [Eubacteriales bacterium]|nr:HD domain-containing protein [Eubacteriales bacterium]